MAITQTNSALVDMCYKTECKDCGKATWAGCGNHVESALRGVKKEDRCKCENPSKGSGCTIQ